jgi:hypothetical protein
MELLHWLLQNFGIFFSIVFLFYIFLIIRRLTILYDFLRYVPYGEGPTDLETGNSPALQFLQPMFDRLQQSVDRGGAGAESLIEAVWNEIDCRISIHFTSINGYVNTLILVGFAGTIFGSIGAFNQMFQGLAVGKAAAEVFSDAWNHGLGTALYTSLGSAMIGGITLTFLMSRFYMTKAKRLETLVSLRVSEILDSSHV